MSHDVLVQFERLVGVETLINQTAQFSGPSCRINAPSQRLIGLTQRSSTRDAARAMAPTPRARGAHNAAQTVTPASGSLPSLDRDNMPPPPARTPAGAALPRRARHPPAVTPDVTAAPPSRTAPPPSPAATPASTDALPPPPALTSAPAPRGVKRPRAADASSGRKRPRAVTHRDRFVGARLDDAGEAYRAHTALALAPRRGAQPVLNASLRSSLLPRRTGTRFLSFGSDRAAAPETDAAAAERTLAVARSATSTTATRWQGMKFERCLDIPDVRDDFYSQLVDWSSRGDRLAVALGTSMYVTNAIAPGRGLQTEVWEYPSSIDVASVAWAPGSNHVAVGYTDGLINIVDVATGVEVRKFEFDHNESVGALHWNPVTRCLTSGSRDKCICDFDVRAPSATTTYRLGHDGEVCGLRWRDDGNLLASGGNDNALLIWDLRRATSPCHTMPRGHRAAVKALAWCPTRRDVLASGGGTACKRIRLWNSVSGASLASCHAGGQVTGLAWGPQGTPELVASTGFDQPGIRAYSWSMAVGGRLDCVATLGRPAIPRTQIGERWLGLVASPDRTRVAATCMGETILIWKLFDTPSRRKGAFANLRRDVRRWDGVFGGGPGQVLR